MTLKIIRSSSSLGRVFLEGMETNGLKRNEITPVQGTYLKVIYSFNLRPVSRKNLKMKLPRCCY